MSDTWLRAKFMNRYFDKLAAAAMGTGPCPQIVEFQVGLGLYDDSTTPPTLLTIPPDMAVVPASFFTGTPDLVYLEGNLTCSCMIPTGGVAVPTLGNLFGLFDQAGDLIAVCTTLPDWITPDEEYGANVILSYPFEEV